MLKIYLMYAILDIPIYISVCVKRKNQKHNSRFFYPFSSTADLLEANTPGDSDKETKTEGSVLLLLRESVVQ